MGAWCSQFLGEGDIDAESKPSGGSVGGPNKPKISGKENEKKGDTANTTGSEPKSHGQNGRPSQEPVIDEEKSPESKIPKAQFTRGDVKTSYRFGKQLAKTNFGMVNLANDSKNGEPVVVKTSEIEGRCIEDPEEEVRMLQYLQSLWISRKRKQDPASSSTSCYEAAHPNIVQLKGAFHQPPCYWTVLEYCGGGDAFDYVVEHKSIDEDVVRTLWRDLLVATHFMHTNGICHLDISLENALLSADGKKMKLCDLGAARELVYVDGKLQPYSPHDGCPGKKSYMAPEIFAGKMFYGTKADVFSLGVCLFILLTGKPPFRYPSLACIFYKHIADLGVKTILDHFHYNVSPEATHLLDSMLTMNYDARLDTTAVLNHPWMKEKDSSRNHINLPST